MSSRRLAQTGAAVVSLVLTCLLAACGQPGSPGSSTTNRSASLLPSGGPATSKGTSGDQPAPVALAPVRLGAVVLEATMGIGFSQYPDDPAIRRRPGLVVEYTLRNSGTQPLTALDRVPDSLGSATLPDAVNPEHAWVFWSGDVLRVSKQGFAPRVSFMAAPVIGAREIPAGGALTGRAVVDVPVAVDVPSDEFSAPRSPADATRASRWQFCVQVVARAPGAKASATDPGVLATPFSAPTPEELICTVPTPLTLP